MPDMQEINRNVIAEFRANNGVLSGPMAGAPILLLTTTGRNSGRQFTTPVGFIDAGGRLAVAAANGGSDADPDWFQNIVAKPEVTVELGAKTISSKAIEADEPQRTALLTQLSETLPGMSDHLAATSRRIPVVLLTELGD